MVNELKAANITVPDAANYNEVRRLYGQYAVSSASAAFAEDDDDACSVHSLAEYDDARDAERGDNARDYIRTDGVPFDQMVPPGQPEPLFSANAASAAMRAMFTAMEPAPTIRAAPSAKTAEAEGIELDAVLANMKKMQQILELPSPAGILTSLTSRTPLLNSVVKIILKTLFSGSTISSY